MGGLPVTHRIALHCRYCQVSEAEQTHCCTDLAYHCKRGTLRQASAVQLSHTHTHTHNKLTHTLTSPLTRKHTRTKHTRISWSLQSTGKAISEVSGYLALHAGSSHLSARGWPRPG